MYLYIRNFKKVFKQFLTRNKYPFWYAKYLKLPRMVETVKQLHLPRERGIVFRTIQTQIVEIIPS